MHAIGKYSRPQARYPLQPPLDSSPPLSPAPSSSATSASRSSDSVSTRSYSHDDDVFSSSTLHSRTHGHGARPDASHGSMYHMQTTKDVPIDRRSVLSTATSDADAEQLRRSSSGTPERTLRRTPRSRRIGSPVTTKLPVDEGAPSTNTSGAAAWDQNPQSRAAAWTQQPHLLRSVSSGLTTSSRGSASMEHSPEVPQAVRSHQHDGDGPTVMSSAVKVAQEVTAQPAVRQAEPKHEMPQPTPARRRGAYPLQAPASTSSLRDLPTPPPSPTPEKQSEVADDAAPASVPSEEQTAKRHNQFRRQNYPLQSPASVMDLHQAQLASAPEEEEADEPQKAKKMEIAKAVRRRPYPLQAPASILDLRNTQMQPIAENETVTDENNTQASQSNELKQTPEPMTPRRQAYPLQTSATTANLHESQGQSLVQPKDPNTKAVLTTKASKQSDPDQEASPFIRQAYPIQAPVATVDAQQPPSAPVSKEPGMGETQQPTGESTEEPADEIEMISSKPSQWRRQTYPTQSSDYRSTTPRPPSPDYAISHDRQGKSHEEPTILLPKNIPAVLNSQEGGPTGRTIVVCLDGTGDQFDSDNSNIIHLVSALKKDDPRQVTYYQAGIGTYGANGLSGGFEAASDMAVGSGLGLHVRDAYHFLMHTYKEGDKICIFGFSRGAYTARCLAGMVHKVGLLPPRNTQQIPFAYEFYKDDSRAGWTNSADFKRTFCIDVCVYFLGCFDSVASVGIIPRQLPLSSTPSSKPKYFRHAMALDERRAKFKVCRHQNKNWDDINMPGTTTPTHEDSHRARNHPNLTDEEYERLAGPDQAFESDVLEVWFVGAHADVGGGAVKNVERHKLAQIPLRWMIRQSFECDTGIIFQTKVLAEHGLDVHTLWPKYERLKVPSHGPPPSYAKRYQKELPPRSKRRAKLVHTGKHDNGEPLYHLKSHLDEDWTPEQVEDFYDSLMPMNDQLVQAPTWWILETLPVSYKVPTTPGKFINRVGMNLGQTRAAEEAEPKMHWTVSHRMQQLGYKLGVRTSKGVKWKTVV